MTNSFSLRRRIEKAEEKVMAVDGKKLRFLWLEPGQNEEDVLRKLPETGKKDVTFIFCCWEDREGGTQSQDPEEGPRGPIDPWQGPGQTVAGMLRNEWPDWPEYAEEGEDDPVGPLS